MLNCVPPGNISPTSIPSKGKVNPESNRFVDFILQKIYSDFELQGVMEDKLNSKAYQTISSRIQAEEATLALISGQQDGDG